MKLNLLTINIRGFNDNAAVDTIQRYIQSCNSLPDVVNIQEHKLRGPALQQTGRRLWQQTTCYSIEATVGYGDATDDLGA